MMSRAQKRARGGAKRLDMSPIREALKDRRMWTAFGVVRKPVDAASHYEVITANGQQDVLVHVETAPSGLDVTCRLGSLAGGAGLGLWRIPAVGTEVAVLIPEGEMEFQPLIVATLSTGDTPARMAADRTVLEAPDEIVLVVGSRVVRVKGDQIQLGDAATEAVMKGTTYRTQEAAMNAAIEPPMTAIAAAYATWAAGEGNVAPPGPFRTLYPTTSALFDLVNAAFAAHAAALTTFEGQAATYLSATVKTE